MASILDTLKKAVGKGKKVPPAINMNANQKAARQIPGKSINKITDRNRKLEDIAKELENS